MPEASMTSQECREIRDKLASLDTRVEVQSHAMQSLTERIGAFMNRDRAADCPLRVEIARAANNTHRLVVIEGRIRDLELEVTKAAVRGGIIGSGSVGLAAAVGYGVAKAMGLA